VVKVAERQLFLTEDPAERTPRALELALLWRDRLRDAKKATVAFERVLEIDPRTWRRSARWRRSIKRLRTSNG